MGAFKKQHHKSERDTHTNCTVLVVRSINITLETNHKIQRVVNAVLHFYPIFFEFTITSWKIESISIMNIYSNEYINRDSLYGRLAWSSSITHTIYINHVFHLSIIHFSRKTSCRSNTYHVTLIAAEKYHKDEHPLMPILQYVFEHNLEVVARSQTLHLIDLHLPDLLKNKACSLGCFVKKMIEKTIFLFWNMRSINWNKINVRPYLHLPLKIDLLQLF